MAPQAVELCDIQTLMEGLRLVSPSSLRAGPAASAGDLRHEGGREAGRRFASIEEAEEDEEDQQPTHGAGKYGTHADESLQLLPSSSSSSAAVSSHPQSISCPTSSAIVMSTGTTAAASNRQIMRCMCSSALIFFSLTALLLLLPVVLPPLPPPPSELMLLPVAILLLLVCAALTPLPPRTIPLSPSAVSSGSSTPIPLLPLPHSLPLRSSMPL